MYEYNWKNKENTGINFEKSKICMLTVGNFKKKEFISRYFIREANKLTYSYNLRQWNTITIKFVFTRANTMKGEMEKEENAKYEIEKSGNKCT